jgi:hypothetical protein
MLMESISIALVVLLLLLKVALCSSQLARGAIKASPIPSAIELYSAGNPST